MEDEDQTTPKASNPAPPHEVEPSQIDQETIVEETKEKPKR
jgi:hypothetical protein